MDIKDRVLVIEDDKSIRNFFRTVLEANNYEVLIATTGAEGYSMVTSQCPDVVILDLGLPDMDGMTILKNVRQWSSMPVLVVSARTHEKDKVAALDAGADDYITKPFQPLEAVARVKSNLRRFYSLGAGENQPKEILQVRDLTLHVDSCILKKGEETIDLTSVEFRIMRLFMENPNKVFTKQQLYEQGWEDAFYTDDNNVMVCISKLRGKLSEDPNAYIRTIRGLGYRLENTV